MHLTTYHPPSALIACLLWRDKLLDVGNLLEKRVRLATGTMSTKATIRKGRQCLQKLQVWLALNGIGISQFKSSADVKNRSHDEIKNGGETGQLSPPTEYTVLICAKGK